MLPLVGAQSRSAQHRVRYMHTMRHHYKRTMASLCESVASLHIHPYVDSGALVVSLLRCIIVLWLISLCALPGPFIEYQAPAAISICTWQRQVRAGCLSSLWGHMRMVMSLCAPSCPMCYVLCVTSCPYVYSHDPMWSHVPMYTIRSPCVISCPYVYNHVPMRTVMSIYIHTHVPVCSHVLIWNNVLLISP